MTKPGYRSIVYSVQISVQKDPDVVFKDLIDLAQWWPEDFRGEPVNKDSEFVFTTGDGHYSTNKVIEFIPGKKVAWQTTASLRKSDNYDWSGTKFIFDLAPAGDATMLKFTYDGVVLEHETEKLAHICDLTLKEMFYNHINKS